ncbi:30S ribosomal protein S12 methylthiotransferase RimO [Oxalobacter vibrioformis]|uniref:Ribosomal protein uS12 methylthiotransferase RimO n=1 Tax=Oxalobacter vibrioformis TaxID=933080 RepID=A0A9E9M135_9BURK|nr:30S ribosomal protein S12 methylthiotransferase RimO [Oxalobacter vibrioformis]WAW10893.1 30S ribosomal protein S12 methylthiotransferase RimO [Oxalobacter vibrioformis]
MNTLKRIGFVSLGCPKALVDSEHILTRLRAEGYQTAATYDDADLVIINTCGFIDAAVEESLETISEALAENGKVIVTGCLGAKRDDAGQGFIRQVMPDVLEITGPDALEEVMQAVHKHLPRPHEPFIDLVPPQGIKLTPRHYAYLKISEGCNHSCTFCIIPSLRGRLVTRSVGDVLSEAERLFNAGVKELLLVSQDTGAYGVDMKYRTGFWEGRPVKTHVTQLAESLGKLARRYDAWIRLHYVYPYPHVDHLVSLMQDGLILPYLDVPLQHAHPDVLRRMKRPASGEKHLERMMAWRDMCPDITIRSTFITGFPGETDAEFDYLMDFLKVARIDRLGCFPYSPVEGAAANYLADPVPEAIREERRAQLMIMQEEISREKLQEKIGKTLRILTDEPVRGGAIGRSFADAPEIDGVVYVKKPKGMRRKLKAGEFVSVRITDADAHDMWGEMVP